MERHDNGLMLKYYASISMEVLRKLLIRKVNVQVE
jgi:hypothetical protein